MGIWNSKVSHNPFPCQKVHTSDIRAYRCGCFGLILNVWRVNFQPKTFQASQNTGTITGLDSPHCRQHAAPRQPPPLSPLLSQTITATISPSSPPLHHQRDYEVRGSRSSLQSNHPTPPPHSLSWLPTGGQIIRTVWWMLVGGCYFRKKRGWKAGRGRTGESERKR